MRTTVINKSIDNTKTIRIFHDFSDNLEVYNERYIKKEFGVENE